MLELPKRILDRRIITDKGCWEWQGHRIPQGYGQFSINGKTVYVHRYVGCLHFGISLDSPTQILHNCDNPACFNPEHLFKGSPGINARDSASKGRRSKPRGSYRKKGKSDHKKIDAENYLAKKLEKALSEMR